MKRLLALLVVASVASVAVGLTSTGLAGQQRGAAPSPLIKENATIKLSEHVYVIPDGGLAHVPNVGIIVGSQATLVVNAGLGPENARAILRQVARVSRNATLYVVSTNVRPEQALGEATFPATATIIRTREAQLDVEEFGLDEARQLGETTASLKAFIDGVSYRRADVFFTRNNSLDLGGVRVELIALGPAHTRGDTGVFVDGDRVLFAGDVVPNKSFPSFASPYSSVAVWLNSLDRLQAFQPARIVPGRGPIAGGTIIGDNREYLLTLQSVVSEQGPLSDSLETLIERVTMQMTERFPSWDGASAIGSGVKAAFGELREQ